MIENLYSEFDTDVTIRIEKGKSFSEERVDFEALKKIEGIQDVSRAVEEVVILKLNDKWLAATMIGVDSSFLVMSQTSKHIVEGQPLLHDRGSPRAIIGASLLDKLEGYIPKGGENQLLVCYVAKRDAKIRLGKSPFNQEVIAVSGSMNYNREINGQFFLIPLELSRQLMKYNSQISAIYVDAKPGVDNSELKERIQKLVGKDFVVKTNFEKNELIFKTSQSERIIVLIILLFIFVLAAFNLVASLTMLFVEKLDNLQTMVSFGTPRSTIFRVFFIEGLLISGRGIFIGLIFGYFVCFLQLQFDLIVMPNSNGEAFPINLTFLDGLLIFSLVSVLSVLFSYFPVKYLIQRNIPSN